MQCAEQDETSRRTELARAGRHSPGLLAGTLGTGQRRPGGRAGVGARVEGGSDGLRPGTGPARDWREAEPGQEAPGEPTQPRPGRGAGQGGCGPGTAPLAGSAQTFRSRRWNARGRLLVALGRVPAGRGGSPTAGPLNPLPGGLRPATDPARVRATIHAGHHAAPPPGTAPAALAAAAAAAPGCPRRPRPPGPPGLPEAGDPRPGGQPRAPPRSGSPRRCALFGGRPARQGA